MLLYDPVFYKDNFKNAGQKSKSVSDQLKTKAVRKANGNVRFILSLKDQY